MSCKVKIPGIVELKSIWNNKMIQISNRKIMAFLIHTGERPNWKRWAERGPMLATVIQENVLAPIYRCPTGSWAGSARASCQ